MQYCDLHQRGLIPAGIDTRQRLPVPASWVPVSREVVALAHAYAVTFHCTAALTMEVVPCDQCREEAS